MTKRSIAQNFSRGPQKNRQRSTVLEASPQSQQQRTVNICGTRWFLICATIAITKRLLQLSKCILLQGGPLYRSKVF